MAAAASDLFPSLAGLSIVAVEQVVTVALVLILFDGGMGIGARKLRKALGPVVLVGVVGTVLTAAALAVLAHLLFGIGWTVALLLGTALAPTDPAVVFSVLGNREVRGRAGVIIEGESGANDPVGIALTGSADYVFVHVGDEERVRVLQTTGVVVLCPSRDAHSPLGDEEVKLLRECAAHPHVFEPHPFLCVGQRAQGKAGYVCGMGRCARLQENS